MAIVILAVAALSLFVPRASLWVQTGWINYLLISAIAICLIVMAVVSHNAEKILTTGAVVFAVVILHNLLGYACGFGLGKLLRLDKPKTKALSVEIGMQNSGLATSLAGSAFPNLAMATVPGAVFSVWHNVSGAVLANIFRRNRQ